VLWVGFEIAELKTWQHAFAFGLIARVSQHFLAITTPRPDNKT
jgi:hypothetical protein